MYIWLAASPKRAVLRKVILGLGSGALNRRCMPGTVLELALVLILVTSTIQCIPVLELALVLILVTRTSTSTGY